MPLQSRAYRGQQDWQEIAALIEADPKFHHPIDFPWRLCSTSLETPQNAAIWVDENGQMRVLAALQFPWLTLDYAIHPEIRTWEIESQILDWGEKRLNQIAAESNRHFPFNVSAFGHELERIAFLEARGYSRWENYLAVLNRPLSSIPEPKIPEGFIIR